MKKKANPNQPEQIKDQPKELTPEELDAVTGAGDPFADIPSVPTQPIDDELRKDG